MTVEPSALFAASSEDQGVGAAEIAAAQVEAALRVAAALSAAGRPVDLTGLNLEIGRLCAGLLDLSPELGRRMRPHLIRVLGALDRLAATVVPPCS